ncbi:asparagine synthetase B family protein [Candidatus Hydrogenedentota bacterium]
MSAIFGFTGPRDRKTLLKMSNALSHRGAHCIFFDETDEISIGYRSHFEESLREKLGTGIYREEDAAVALAGHLTNADEFQPVLPSILQMYREQGLAFAKSLRGAFVLVLCDGDTTHLIRDSAGMRTIYYGTHDKRFFFSVEPKGILAVPRFPRRIRPAAVARFLTFSFQPGKDTMLQDLSEAPAACTVSVNGFPEPRLRRYSDFEVTGPREELSDSEWISRWRDTFQQSVKERLPGSEPVGVFLSGGIDSSVVAAEVARQHTGPLKSYAVHFGEKYPNELEYAKMVAEHCNIDHEEVLIRPRNFLPRLRKIIWHLDDVIGDPVAMPNFELSRLVSRDTRWVFNGEGGDPLFGGPKNIPMMLHHWYGGIERAPNFRQTLYLASYRRAYEELPRLLSPEWLEQIDMKRDLEELLTPFFQSGKPANFLDKLTAINIRLKGAHLILPKVERMTGAWGLTPLSPLFDERLLHMSFEMPSRFKLDKGIEKVILKEAYARDLPEEIIARPKSGMRVPVHYWLKGEMKRYARNILGPRNVRRVGIFNPERVKQLLRYDTQEGPGRYGLRLWMLITFEIWRRIVIEGESP